MSPRRTDHNQAEIVKALRDAGCGVVDLHAVGNDFPDIIAGRSRRNILIEIKSDNGRLTPGQAIFHRDWPGQIAIARSVEEALEIVGIAVYTTGGNR